MDPRLSVRLYLMAKDSTVDMDLNIITEKLNIIPTKTRKKEDWPKPSILAGIAKDGWEYKINKETSRRVSLQVDKLQKILLSKIDVINELCKEYRLETSVTIVIEAEVGNEPEMVLTAQNIKFLSLINAEIGFDLYIYNNDDE